MTDLFDAHQEGRDPRCRAIEGGSFEEILRRAATGKEGEEEINGEGEGEEITEADKLSPTDHVKHAANISKSEAAHHRVANKPEADLESGNNLESLINKWKARATTVIDICNERREASNIMTDNMTPEVRGMIRAAASQASTSQPSHHCSNQTNGPTNS
jgi:hypothetical protein